MEIELTRPYSVSLLEFRNSFAHLLYDACQLSSGNPREVRKAEVIVDTLPVDRI